MSISFFETVISSQAIELATAALRSGSVNQGPRVAEFEDVLSRDYQLSHPVALNSGTCDCTTHSGPHLVERRESFVRALKGRGIPTSVVDRRIDRYRVFGGTRAALVGQRQFDERQISLPLHSGLSEHDVQQVITGVHAGW